MEYQNLVVFVEFPNPSEPSLGLLKALTFMNVTLVGYHTVPNGRTINEARREHERAHTDKLREIADRLEGQGIRVEIEVEFGRDAVQSRDRWAGHRDVDGILLPRGEGTLGRVLVGIRDTRNVDRIADFVDFIDRERIVHISLLHVVSDSEGENGRREGQQMLSEMKSELVDRGVNPFAIHKELRFSDDPINALTQHARSFDLAVLGKTERTIKEEVFGPVSNQIADETESSVLVLV